MYFYFYRKAKKNKNQYNSKQVKFSSANDVESIQKSKYSDNFDNSKL